jgi:hypothetical protein
MIRIRHNRNVALAGLAVSALLAGAEKKIVINDGDEVYTATFDDTKAPEASMREWVLLSPYVGTVNSDENFYMAIRESRDVEKIEKVFYAPRSSNVANRGAKTARSIPRGSRTRRRASMSARNRSSGSTP